MTWALAGQYTLWAAGLFIVLIIIVFCAAGIATLYDDYILTHLRADYQFRTLLANECATRKSQNQELRGRMRRLELAIKELNSGLDI